MKYLIVLILSLMLIGCKSGGFGTLNVAPGGNGGTASDVDE
jgi:hypothetical protein